MDVSDKLTTEIKHVLSNRNNVQIPLTIAALRAFGREDVKHKVKKYFASGDDTTPIHLDSLTELHFVKIFRNTNGVSIRQGDVQISFTENTCTKLDNFQYAVECYRKELEARLDHIAQNIGHVKALFENFFYSSVYDYKLVKKILKSSEIDPTNIIQLELINIFNKKFIEIIHTEKRDDSLTVVE